MSFIALILAGSRGGQDAVAAYAGVVDKALVMLEEETLLARVFGAVREAGAARIAVSTASDAVAAEALRLGADVLHAAPGPSDSVASAFDTLGAPMLVTTADHALLRAQWITRFLDDLPPSADVCALLAERGVIESAVPSTRRTYLRFADGHWSGCNLFYLATPRAAAAVELWRSIEADRKRPWKIVRRLGVSFLLRYLAGKLDLATAVERLGRVADVRASVVTSPFGQAAIDVDKPDDLDTARVLARAYSCSRDSGDERFGRDLHA